MHNPCYVAGRGQEVANLYPPTWLRGYKALVRGEGWPLRWQWPLAAAAWVGWATGWPLLTGILGNWPPMRPWTALLTVALGAAILLQSGNPSAVRVWAGRTLALLAGVFAVLFLIESATSISLGLDNVWFSEGLRNLSGQELGRIPGSGQFLSCCCRWPWC